MLKDVNFVIQPGDTVVLVGLSGAGDFQSVRSSPQRQNYAFVSHRLSSATIATQILVLENGRLIETGTHTELMKKEGVYYKLFSTQANRYITEAETSYD